MRIPKSYELSFNETELGKILEVLVLEYDFGRTRTRTRGVSSRTRTRTRTRRVGTRIRESP